MLRPHQHEGAHWLLATARRHNGRAILADDPGLGKTRTVIRAMQLAGIRNPLVITPASVREHWRREFQVMDFQGYPSIHSYQRVSLGGTDFRDLYADTVDCLVLDEFHELRSMTAERTKLVLGRAGLARQVPWVFALSGTPMWKHPGNLWPALAGLFGPYMRQQGLRRHQDMLDQFCVWRPTTYGPRIYGAKDTERLTSILSDVMLRRESDIIKGVWWQVLPVEADFTGELIEAETDPRVQDAIHALEHGVELDAEQRPHLAKWRRVVGLLKARSVGAMLREELEGGTQKVVVYAYHLDVIEALREELESLRPVVLTGASSERERTEAVDRFQQEKGVRVFIGQNTAAMTGITLTAASRVVLVEPDWTANVNVQLAGRVARIGQEADHCVAQMVSLAGSLDDVVIRQHYRELALQMEIMDPIVSRTASAGGPA